MEKLKKNYLFMFLFLFVGLIATACSDDDEDLNNGSTITIDGVESKIWDASFNFYPKGLMDNPPCVNCGLTFMNDETPYRMEFKIIYVKSEDDLEVGQDVFDDFLMLDFRNISYVSDCSRFYEESGKIIVKEISHKNFVLEFKNFKFEKDDNGYETNHTINGTLRMTNLN